MCRRDQFSVRCLDGLMPQPPRSCRKNAVRAKRKDAEFSMSSRGPSKVSRLWLHQQFPPFSKGGRGVPDLQINNIHPWLK